MILQVTPKELLYHRKNFYETLAVHGIPCTISSIGESREETHDFYGDIRVDVAHTVSIQSRITYDETPTIHTLKSLGMYVDDEDPPLLANIPVYYEDLSKAPAEFVPKVDDLVTIVINPIDTNSSTRKFLIKEFVGKGFPNVVYYICKLVPYRTDEVEVPEEGSL